MAHEAEILRIKLMFKGLNKVSAATTFPSVSTLSTSLNDLVGNNKTGYRPVDNVMIGRFATGSVEMWHRALHSFFISASLTDASPLWASVAGYYSSHYIMRAFAHLFGYYQLFNKRLVIQLDLSGANYVCNIIKKDGADREHKVYWKLVKNYFVNDPFFYLNIDSQPLGLKAEFKSDGGHRNRANYADHIGKFPVFKPLDNEAMRKRIQKLSGIEVNDVPIPDVYEYPDINNVQLIAYHRILKYRAFLDEIFTTKNRFWETQRNPTWRPDYFDFQVVKADYSGILAQLIA